jgi:uncharacterized RDD family membrane protein YckC
VAPDLPVSERLAAARAASGEPLAALARRIGVRQENLAAIEQGRFADLPSGIYGRAAVRSFAAAYGLDPAEALAACEALLRNVEEPIEGLARIRGLRQARPAPVAKAEAPAAPQPHRALPSPGDDWLEFPDWRPLAAAAIDAGLIAGLLLLVTVSAALSLVVPIAALQGSAVPLALVGLVLGLGYFVWFGGLGGATLGARAMHLRAASSEAAMLTLRDIANRTARSATADVRCIVRLGTLLGTVLTTDRSAV